MKTNLHANISRTELIRLFGKKSNLKGFQAIICNWLAYLSIGILIYLVITAPSSWWLLAYPFLLMLSACSLRGFDNLTHEASHHNVFKRRDWNYQLQFLYAIPVHKTVENYKRYHNKHHNVFNKNKEEDPDTKQNIRWGVENLIIQDWRMVIWLYGIRFFIQYFTCDNIWYNFLPSLKIKNNWFLRIIFWSFAILIIAVFNLWQIFIFAYLIPYFVMLPFIRFIAESSKHTHVNLDDEFGNARSNIGLIHRLLLHPHNDGYHWMHHYVPGIPFFNLRKAYKYVKCMESIRSRLIESKSPIQTIIQEFKMK